MTKMIAVKTSTKRDSSKMDWAGVAAAAKMLVGLSQGSAGAIAANDDLTIASQQHRTNDGATNREPRRDSTGGMQVWTVGWARRSGSRACDA